MIYVPICSNMFDIKSPMFSPMFPYFPYLFLHILHGSLNVTTEHHPTMRYLIYNCHSKVMSNSPKMGHLPIPVLWSTNGTFHLTGRLRLRINHRSSLLRFWLLGKGRKRAANIATFWGKDRKNYWIALRENLNRKPWFLPSNIGLS